MVAALREEMKRCAIHTITTKAWTLEECVENYVQAGVGGITVWRDILEPIGLSSAASLLADSGLEIVSLCRGGFFPAETSSGRQEAIDENRRALDEAAAIGAPLVVLVCGAVPGMPLEEARRQIRDGIEAILPYARERNVKLAIEPLHPMYADSRSAINTLAQANDLVASLNDPYVGVAVDVYHVWWEPNLEAEIMRAGNTIQAFHVCDWRTPTRDLLTDRALMGEGCIPIRQIREWVEQAGFRGAVEVEIFSREWWAKDPADFLARIVQAWREHC